MRQRTLNPGYTLVELIVTMAVLCVLLAVAFPPALRWRDAAAVRSARDELAAGLGWTRVAAASHGGASLVLDPVTGRFWTRTAGGASPVVDLCGRYGVDIDPGTESPVVFEYDALGIGRLTNRTVRIRRGDVEAGVTVSAYGRYRRW
jgi:prepilin-type N-terminal cleavage/methylation domain-containing protein